MLIIIPDAVWNEIEKIIPVKKSKVGRPLSDARKTLSGVLYVITTGVQWRYLPAYYGKPSTVHGRFMIWVKTGIFDLIFKSSISSAVEFFGVPECFYIDTSMAKAPLANFGGKNPTDRRKNGIKKGLVIDINQIIFSVIVDGANRHDSKLTFSHVEPIKQYLKKPKVLVADSAWDIAWIRKKLAQENIALHASANVRRNKLKRKIKSGGRWRLEQIFGIQQWKRGLKTCWAKSKESFLAFCKFSSTLHNFKRAGIFG